LPLFCDPSWPRKLIGLVRAKTVAAAAASDPPVAAGAAGGIDGLAQSGGSRPNCTLGLVFFVVYILCQVVMPMRQFLIPQNLSWSEFGSRYSWSIGSDIKDLDEFEITVTDPKTGIKETPKLQRLLTKRQYAALVQRPDLIIQFAHELARRREVQTGTRPVVTVKAAETLNRNPSQALIDGRVDLANQPIYTLNAPYIVPLPHH
jgi:vitamin K-dependent gamma-carboxylase